MLLSASPGSCAFRMCPPSPPVRSDLPSSTFWNPSENTSVTIPVKMTPSERATAIQLSSPPTMAAAAPFNCFHPKRPIYTHARFLPPARVHDTRLDEALVGDGAYLDTCEV